MVKGIMFLGMYLDEKDAINRIREFPFVNEAGILMDGANGRRYDGYAIIKAENVCELKSYRDEIRDSKGILNTNLNIISESRYEQPKHITETLGEHMAFFSDLSKEATLDDLKETGNFHEVGFLTGTYDLYGRIYVKDLQELVNFKHFFRNHKKGISLSDMQGIYPTT